MVHIEDEPLARKLLRHWRGSRTQRAMAEAVGFHSSAVAHWESGRNACHVTVALRMADLAQPGALEHLTTWVRSDWSERVDLASPAGVALLMNDLLRQRDVGEVAKVVGVSRGTVGRWLRAAAEPNLVQFLAFLRALSVQETVVHLLAPTFALEDPAFRQISSRGREVGLALRLDRYRALPRHDAAWVARESARSEDEVALGIDELQKLGAIEWSGTHWVVRHSPPFSFRHWPRDASPGGPGPRIRELLHQGRYTRSQVILANFTEEDLERVQRVLFDASAEIKRIIQRSRPRGDRVGYVNLALLLLADQSGDVTTERLADGEDGPAE